MCIIYTCRCKNITVNGIPFPKGAVPNVDFSKLHDFKDCNYFSCIQKHSIEVKNIDYLNIKKENCQCYKVVCNKCLSSFYVNNCQGRSFVGKIISKNCSNKNNLTAMEGEKRRRCERSMSSVNISLTKCNTVIPESIKHLFVSQSNHDEASIEDEIFSSIENSDFELMFRNTLNPMVGSYNSPSIGNIAFRI